MARSEACLGVGEGVDEAVHHPEPRPDHGHQRLRGKDDTERGVLLNGRFVYLGVGEGVDEAVDHPEPRPNHGHLSRFRV